MRKRRSRGNVRRPLRGRVGRSGRSDDRDGERPGADPGERGKSK
ncbi:MAG: hypothetical protein HSCHL_0164 [Hydrogenibacillus schlegelii]|uniref:Uncharacterized protein n=1 Tax=Hydrogenibacillus schlegelii TaxID=1484 RepID=A0A2T5GEK0_HYDSH|nr:MAG: hypothetical protein HSCHL_0164 [Hydrogenibacillus schlegelii]